MWDRIRRALPGHFLLVWTSEASSPTPKLQCCKAGTGQKFPVLSSNPATCPKCCSNLQLEETWLMIEEHERVLSNVLPPPFCCLKPHESENHPCKGAESSKNEMSDSTREEKMLSWWTVHRPGGNIQCLTEKVLTFCSWHPSPSLKSARLLGEQHSFDELLHTSAEVCCLTHAQRYCHHQLDAHPLRTNSAYTQQMENPF